MLSMLMYDIDGKLTADSIWIIVAAVLSLVGGITLYFTFLSKSNEGKFKGFLGWLQDFLSFKKMFLEHLLRITYVILALYVTLGSFAVISNFLLFLCYLIVGNIAVRLIYEFSLILLVVCRNTTEINEKLSKVSITSKDEKNETK